MKFSVILATFEKIHSKKHIYMSVLSIITVVFIAMLIFFSKTPKKKKKGDSLDKFLNEMDNETRKLKEENKEWEAEAKVLFGKRKEIFALDKKGNESIVLPMYLDHLADCEASKRFSYTNNVVVIVDRIIILYGKLKDKKKQKEFIETAIAKYPDYSKISEWKVRLNKLHQTA